jgi:hypothetical protein
LTTTDHPYMRTVENYGRTERQFEIKRFCADLAPLVGAAVVCEDGSHDRPNLVRNDGLTLYVCGKWNAPGRVSVSVGAPEITRRLDHSHYVAKFPSATFDAARPLDKLAADIRRRLIEPAAEPLEKLRQALATQEGGRAATERHAAAILARWPAARITFADERKTQATLYLAGVSASLTSDGGLYVDRIGGVDSARTMRLLAALADPLDVTA